MRVRWPRRRAVEKVEVRPSRREAQDPAPKKRVRGSCVVRSPESGKNAQVLRRSATSEQLANVMEVV